MDMKEKVVSELNARKGTWPSISKTTGVSYGYLAKLAKGNIYRPSYEYLTLLNDHFNTKEAA